MTNEKILSYVDDLVDAYAEPVQRLSGLTRKPKDIIRTVEFYTSNQYLSGNKDELGRDKPFYNVCNYRVTTAKVATDLDVKDIKYEADSLQDSLQAMMINKELYQYLKETNFSQTLNEMGQTRPKYGGLLVKRHEVDGKKGMDLKIEVVDWVNVDFDPSDVAGGVIIERFYLQPSEFASKSDVWENVKETLDAHAKANKNKPAKIEILEVSGEFPETFDTDIEDGDESKYKRMCFYIAQVGKKKFLLYKEDQKVSNFKYLPWEAIGKGFGRGVVEDGFESQWAINDTMISMKNAMELSGKVILSTNSKKVSGNALTDVSSGHIFEMEANATLNSLNLLPSAFPQFQNVIELWNQQYDRASSTFQGANTGEAPTAGTPYSQVALLNQVANSPFEYQREVWGIFLNELLNDWILPFIKKRILKKHNLVADYTPEELELIDEAIVNYAIMPNVIDAIIAGKSLDPQALELLKQVTKEALVKENGAKREFIIPEKWMDVGGKISANITGELKNKAAVLQSLSQVAKDIMASFNPNTGEYMAMKDPTLSKLYGTIIEMSGIPLSFAQLKGNQSSQPQPMQADVTAVKPA